MALNAHAIRYRQSGKCFVMGEKVFSFIIPST